MAEDATLPGLLTLIQASLLLATVTRRLHIHLIQPVLQLHCY
jgi:hypothetical protein